MGVMLLRQTLGFSIILAALTAFVAALSVVYVEGATEGPVSTIISRFVVVLVFAQLGLMVARESELRGSIFVTSEKWWLSIRDLVNYGVLPGLVLGLINYLFFYSYRYSLYVTPRIREIQSVRESFIISLDSGVVEEVIYRLFILSCFVFVFRHLYKKIKPLWPSVVAIIPGTLALVLSSLLFAMAHNIYGFTAAFYGGMLLGFIYLRSGIESAIAAHFFANFVFFSASYL